MIGGQKIQAGLSYARKTAEVIVEAGTGAMAYPATAAAFRAVSWAKVPGVADVILLRDG